MIRMRKFQEGGQSLSSCSGRTRAGQQAILVSEIRTEVEHDAAPFCHCAEEYLFWGNATLMKQIGVGK
jgi:hypothetical protein